MKTIWDNVYRRGPDDCWPWLRSLSRKGYGRASLNGTRMAASRAVWILTHGDPGDLHVLHACDNPPCCNPAHLFLGTNADNQADMDAKGRRSPPPIRKATGLRYPKQATPRKLTTEQACAIRADLRTGKEIGREYGISAVMANKIKRGVAWH